MCLERLLNEAGTVYYFSCVGVMMNVDGKYEAAVTTTG